MTEQEKYINALNGLKNADVKIDDEIRYPSIKAIEKQIAKKPYILPVSKTDHFTYCPNCKTDNGYVSPSMSYCENCGQKLLWGGDD